MIDMFLALIGMIPICFLLLSKNALMSYVDGRFLLNLHDI
jgi:hypothetical protein